MPPRQAGVSPRRLTEADRAEWANYVRHIASPRGKPTRAAVEIGAAAQPTPSPRLPSARPPLPPPVAKRATPALAVGDQPAGIDSATWQRFRTGKLSATRTLDLHGQTAQRAFQALAHFLRTAHAERIRCVEVVTGRGSGEGGGVLKREFPHWLNRPDIRPLVLAASHPHAANPGSVRLLLRRVR
jgi:DNA-nicking Smr family endonuclease